MLWGWPGNGRGEIALSRPLLTSGEWVRPAVIRTVTFWAWSRLTAVRLLAWKGMTVGQLAGHAGLSADTIRSNLEIGLLPEPPRTSANARRFPAATLDRLTVIKDAQRVGLSRDDIKLVVAARDEGRCPGALTRRLLGQRLDDVDGQTARLTAQREDVAAVLADPAVLHDQACVMAADVYRTLALLEADGLVACH